LAYDLASSRDLKAPEIEAPQQSSAAPNRLSSASKLPDVTAAERRSIEHRSRPSAALIHETIRAEGESELDRTASALLLSGFAAGLSMGFSLISEGLLQAHLPEAPWRELVSNFGYTIGFLIVVLGRQQLFTENTLTPILPLLRNRDAKTLLEVMRLWALVLAANLVATFVIAAVLAWTDLFPPEVKAAFAEIGRPVLADSFGTTFLKAVFAGWLIALMVWLLPAADAARPFLIVIITYIVALGDFTHIVAGAVDASYLVASGEVGFFPALNSFFLPTLLGNVVGGVALVAALNYGQAAPEIEQ
jgi:formate/nitrite transporter FocA (FNT family)